MSRLFVLVKRECIDVSRNYVILSMMMVPLFIAFMYELKGVKDETVFLVPLLITYAFIGMVIQPIMIAEEKEKGSFTIYRVSPFHQGHLIVAKGIVSILLALFVTILIAVMGGFSIENMLLFIYTAIATTLFSICAGTLVGFYSKNAMDTSVKGIPCAFFLLLPMFANFYEENGMLTTINNMLPGQAIFNGLFVSLGGEMTGVWSDSLLVTGWTVAACVFCLVIYKKRQSL
ncbi:ABC transporter permease [Priestia taiwanensis]|uniref:ABC transporter permease n=1 Tax=Priestia taiwanensis TaxID=1347902 RepID=A0A917ERL2_9BACI|nr:ABC transporter permease [Priestia taiwanensis]MBM7364408.1 ABC-type multidrug transport system permease subunit [Priestia taiwanensis]GGE81649.1 ABC transporter permease [Priestia taiwanensis]